MRALPLLVGLLLGLAACSSGDSVEPLSDRVAIDLVYNRLPGGARIVSGEVRNTSPEPIRVAQIQVALYDANNRRLSTLHIEVRDVAPGAAKAFREPVEDDRVAGVSKRQVVLL